MDTDLGSFDSRTSEGVDSATSNMTAREDLVFFFSRLVFGLLFSCHGSQKLLGILGPQANLHDPWMLTAGIFELAGGLAIAMGFLTRPIAFLLCGEMAVAYFKFHFPKDFWPILNQGELAVLYCFFFLYLSVRGAGTISIDGLRGKA
jgi:putative oxidoreductase